MTEVYGKCQKMTYLYSGGRKNSVKPTQTIWHNKQICTIFVIVEFTKQFIMAKAKKLSTEELEQVRKAVNTANNFTAQLGQLEIQKAQLLSQALTAQAQVTEEQKILEEKYGSVSVNLETGEITETTEE